MEIWPALDIDGGQVVRLNQGDFARATIYASDPLQYLQTRFGTYPPRLHLVDLAGARSGSFGLYDLVQKLAERGTRVEAGGGFRSLAAVSRAFECGAARVVVGSQLVADPEFRRDVLSAFASRMVAGLDVRDGRLRVSGWRESGPLAQDFWQSLCREGWEEAQVTDIGRDGTLGGVRESFWRAWADMPGRIGAGGGVSSLEDIARLSQWGLDSVVVGKAWIEGRIPLEELV